MIVRTGAFFALLLAVQALASAMPAASHDPRDKSFGWVNYRRDDAQGVLVEQGSVSAIPSATGGAAKIRWKIFTGSDLSVNLPLDSVGSLQELSDDVYLVSGHKVVSGQLQGVLCVAHCLRTPVKSIQISDTKTYAGIDHYRVAFNALDQKLYSLDWQSKTFLAADWAGLGHPFPKAFASILTGLSVPFRTAYLWERIKVDAAVPGFRMRGMPIVPYAWIRQENGVWVSTRDPSPPLSAPVWRLDHFAAVPTGAQARQTNGQILQGPNQILVAGKQGPVSLLDENGFPHGQWNLVANWQFQVFSVPAVFNDIPGLPFRLSNPGAGVGDLWFRPHVRYGAPVQGSLLILGGTRCWPATCMVGESDYKITMPYDLSASATQHLSLTQYVWIGFRSADGTDPVDLIGGAAILRPDIVDSQGFTVAQGEEMGALSHTIPIAADPGLTGIVMLYQWVVPNPDGTVSYSDVFGTSILPAGSGSAQSNSTKGGSTRLQVSTSAWGRAKGKERIDLLSKAKTTMAKALGLSSSYLSKTWVRDYEALRKKMIRQALHKTK